MKKYLSFFRLRLNIALQYRAAAIAGFLTQFFWGIMQILIYQAFYSVVTSNNMSLEQLVSYIWLKQAFYTVVSASTDSEIRSMIENGNISYELCKPTNIYWMWYFKTLANKIAGGFLKCIPTLLITPFLPLGLSLQAPAGLSELVFFIITFLLSTLLMAAIINIFYISLFYTMSSKGTTSIFYAVVEFFGGNFIPIALMPSFWQTFCYMLPFSLAADLPFRIYSGNIAVGDCYIYILLQIIWLIVLTVGGSFIVNKRLKKLVVQGRLNVLLNVLIQKQKLIFTKQIYFIMVVYRYPFQKPKYIEDNKEKYDMKTMKVYFKTILMLLKMQLEYRKAFIISFIGSFIITFLLIISVYFLFEEFNQIGNWTFFEVAFLFGMVFFNFSLSEMFLRGLDHFENTIKSGEFDRILIRPQNALMQSTCMEFDFSKIGRMLQSLLVMIISIININIDWDIYKVFVFIFMNIGCFIIFFGIFILKASFCFWTVDGLEFMNILAEGGKKVAQYPIDIYAKWFRWFFTFIVPFGLVNYYPVLFLFGKSDNAFFGIVPIFTIIFLIPCLFLWKLGIKHYESTGS